MTHAFPLQPLVRDADGEPVFRANAIVVALLEHAAATGGGLAKLLGDGMEGTPTPGLFSQADWQQFAQLIGYSLDGYLHLCYVDRDAREAARAHASSAATQAAAGRVQGHQTPLVTRTA